MAIDGISPTTFQERLLDVEPTAGGVLLVFRDRAGGDLGRVAVLREELLSAVTDPPEVPLPTGKPPATGGAGLGGSLRSSDEYLLWWMKSAPLPPPPNSRSWGVLLKGDAGRGSPLEGLSFT